MRKITNKLLGTQISSQTAVAGGFDDTAVFSFSDFGSNLAQRVI